MEMYSSPCEMCYIHGRKYSEEGCKNCEFNITVKLLNKLTKGNCVFCENYVELYGCDNYTECLKDNQYSLFALSLYRLSNELGGV